MCSFETMSTPPTGLCAPCAKPSSKDDVPVWKTLQRPSGESIFCFAHKRNISRKLKEKIRPVLVDELIYSQMSDLQARMRTKALVKRYLDTELKQ